MRALGLPNTKHFHEITRIEDAIARASHISILLRSSPLTLCPRPTVAEKLKQEGKQELAQSELTEELEDADGNVYNRKVRSHIRTLRAGFADHPCPLARRHGRISSGRVCCSFARSMEVERGFRTRYVHRRERG